MTNENLSEMMKNQTVELPQNRTGRAYKQFQERVNTIYDGLIKFSENYPQILNQIYDVFQDVAKKHNIDIGKMKIVWVGGRLQGKSIKVGSTGTSKRDTDIDLKFYFERNANVMDNHSDEIYARCKDVLERWGIKVELDAFHFIWFFDFSDLKSLEKPYEILLEK
jgi:uncharacterized protein YukE